MELFNSGKVFTHFGVVLRAIVVRATTHPFSPQLFPFPLMLFIKYSVSPINLCNLQTVPV